MDLDFKKKRMVKVSIVPHVEEIINNFPEEMGTSTAMTPAGEHFKQGIQKMQN